VVVPRGLAGSRAAGIRLVRNRLAIAMITVACSYSQLLAIFFSP
jgi:hypothetical protein